MTHTAHTPTPAARPQAPALTRLPAGPYAGVLFLLLVVSLACGRLQPAEGATASVPAWRLPLPGGQPSATFAIGPLPWSPGHRGVDLVAPQSAGRVVVAPQAGTVAFAGVVAGTPVVVVAHPGRMRSSLMPVRATVAVGTRVSAGEPLGTVSTASRASTTLSHLRCPEGSTCLHWGVRDDGSYVDPLLLLVRWVVRLVPYR